MIFPVDDLVWRLSQYMQLEPGDIISTGTPQAWPFPVCSPTCSPATSPKSRSPASAGSARPTSASTPRPAPAPTSCSADQARSTNPFDTKADIMNAEFSGLTAIVTGGASGIGRAVAELLLEGGANVAVLDLNPTDAPEQALGLRCDVSDRASVDAAVEAAAQEYGGIDIVINNAGIGAQGQVDANDDDEWDRVLNVNVVSVARVTAAALPHLRRSEHAAVVQHLLGGGHCRTARPGPLLGDEGRDLLDDPAMAADHVREGIRVNAVCPGTANTPWVMKGLMAKAEDPEEELRQLNARQPHGRLVEPAEVARTIVFLASPLQGSTTGTAVAVDGGMQGLRLRPQ